MSPQGGNRQICNLIYLNLLLALNAFLLTSAWIVDFNNPIVHTQYGSIKGKIDERRTKFNRRPICSFLSIPYARPPVGSNRFLVSRFAHPIVYDASISERAADNGHTIYHCPLKPHRGRPAASGTGRLAKPGRHQQTGDVSAS